MSDHAFEVAYLPVKSGIDLTTGETGDIWSGTLNTIAEQPGVKAIYWGRQIEKPDTVQLIVAWETHAHHLKFIDSPIYEPFLKKLEPVLTGPASIHHLHMPSFPPFSTAGTAPVTECISMYFRPDYPSQKYEESWSRFVEAASETAEEARGLAWGWAREEQHHDKIQGGKAKLFGAFIGWPSVQAHMSYRENPKFPDVIKHLREGPEALEVHHVQFQKWPKP